MYRHPMINRALLIFVSAALFAAPSFAQNAAAEAAEDAAEAVEEVAQQPTTVPPAPMVKMHRPGERSDKRARPIGRWFVSPKPVDYPAAAYVAGDEGNTQISIAISAEGKPGECSVSETSGSALLDTASCNIAMRDIPDFKPAKDDNGTAIASTVERFVRWRKREPEFKTMTIDITMRVNADGTVSDCKVQKLRGEPFPEFKKDDPCKSMNRREDVYRDEEGNPVAKNVRLQMILDVADPEASDGTPAQ